MIFLIIKPAGMNQYLGFLCNAKLVLSIPADIGIKPELIRIDSVFNDFCVIDPARILPS